MANSEHLQLMGGGVNNWNQWRKKNPLIQADLSGADLSRADLSGADLVKADLSGADLVRSNLSGVDLRGTNLSRADLIQADLSGANLSGANLSGANLHLANLSGIQALGVNFNQAIFTGACLEAWHINCSTRFTDSICEYVYLKLDQQERRPRKGSFKAGEFATLFQQAVDTVDLIFKDGINWQAFFQSFQELRNQYVGQDLSIQAIEKKLGGAFVVRLEVAEGTDKSSIESNAKHFYENQLKILEAQYERQLHLQGKQHLEEIQRLIAAERQEKATLMGVLTTMASNQGPKYDLSNAQFGGGFAETVQGNQEGGIINNYGASTEDITRLIAALRFQINTFPTDQKNEALDTLDDLESDLAKPEPDQGRIGRRLKKLMALAAAVGTIASGAAAVSGDLNIFTTNVIELTETLGIPIEQVQIPPTKLP